MALPALTPATPVCTIDVNGINIPTFAQCLNYIVSGYQSIYGSDLELDSSTQDGQITGLLATALNDTNASCVNAYNSFIPNFSQGVGLSSLVKLNGLTRDVPSYSTVAVVSIGQAGTIVTGGTGTDPNGNTWSVPTHTIPLSGQINLTATCQTLGAIALASGVAFTLTTYIFGWQSLTTTAAAVPGQPIELDAQLRQRQSQSTMAPSKTILDGIVGDVLALPGVLTVAPYENDTDLPDVNGQPGRTIALVINGGANQDIANAIGASKSPGSNTYGTTSANYVDAYGINHIISWFRPNFRPVFFQIRLKALTGYTADIGTDIANSLAAWVGSHGAVNLPTTNSGAITAWSSSPVGGLGVGQSLLLNRANVPANLSGPAAIAAAQAANAQTPMQTILANLMSEQATYEIVSLQVAVGNGTMSMSDVSASFIDQFTNDPTTTVVTAVLS